MRRRVQISRAAGLDLGVALLVMSAGSQPISSSRPTAINKSARLTSRMKLGSDRPGADPGSPLQDNTVMRSPPTSRASDARSSVVVTTLSGAAPSRRRRLP